MALRKESIKLEQERLNWQRKKEEAELDLRRRQQEAEIEERKEDARRRSLRDDQMHDMIMRLMNSKKE